jgi:hypothetical protein
MSMCLQRARHACVLSVPHPETHRCASSASVRRRLRLYLWTGAALEPLNVESSSSASVDNVRGGMVLASLGESVSSSAVCPAKVVARESVNANVETHTAAEGIAHEWVAGGWPEDAQRA